MMMTRRQLLTVLTGIPLAALGSLRAAKTWIGADWASGPDRTGIVAVTRYGHMTVQSCPAHGINPRLVRVYLDGQLVHAHEADDLRGCIVRLKRDAAGAFQPGPDGMLQRETVFGDVRIVVLEQETTS